MQLHGPLSHSPSLSLSLFALLCSGARRMGRPHPPLSRAAPSRHFERMGLALQFKELVERRVPCFNESSKPKGLHTLQKVSQRRKSTRWVTQVLSHPVLGMCPAFLGRCPLRYTPPFLPEPCLHPERKPYPRTLNLATLCVPFEVCPLFWGVRTSLVSRRGQKATRHVAPV